ncbi:MAG TPA: GNAT family N-acetyltransferase [Candidatus Saccharimonadales bacterium]|nr:GNAT family N-acetyltransferase [Candidatus Saccharimonadales bacterium]
MAFGPIMQLQVGDLKVELAPLTKDNMPEFINPGMQQASVTRYLSRRSAPVLEDEQEWFERIREEKESLTWGIYVVESDERILIGDTTLFDITKNHIHQATSGSMIFRHEYWGKGIASSIHKARTWYAFQHLGLHRIMSAVYQGNVASLKALQKSGYDLVYIERNTSFIDGTLRHQDNLECLNPNDPFWSQWWHGERPPKHSLVARRQAVDALKWASQNVRLL